eukprot:1163984-Alexandrium_andersonii.AAC.1
MTGGDEEHDDRAESEVKSLAQSKNFKDMKPEAWGDLQSEIRTGFASNVANDLNGTRNPLKAGALTRMDG